MSEAQPQEPSDQPTPAEDPSADVADTQAPAHLEERGLDVALERELDEPRELGDD